MALRKKVVCLLAMALALLMLCGTAMADNFSFLPSRTENGKEYLAHPSSELTTILLIGYDHYANGQIEEEPSQYHLGGQSDFLLLLVIDHKNQQIHQLQFDRDTMTPIKLVATNGKDAGTRRLQLCLAHAYGRTREENNRNTIWQWKSCWASRRRMTARRLTITSAWISPASTSLMSWSAG